MKGWFVAALALFLAAGCAGPPGPRAGSEASADVSLPTTSDETGAIDGSVVTDDLQPIAGVEIGLQETLTTITSGLQGGFAFGDLPPGVYTLAAQRLGYTPLVPVQVEVVASQITTVEIQLVELQISTPYFDTLIFEGHITVGESFLDILTADTGLPGCDACVWDFDAPSNASHLLLEFIFENSVSDPNGDIMGYQLWDNEDLVGDGGGSAISSGDVGPRQQVLVELPRATETRSLNLIGYCDYDWACIDQAFTIYATLFFDGYDPEAFSAMPPAE